METLGNDLYMIKETRSLSMNEIDALMNLYQPLLSSRAICLYFSLLKMPISKQPYDTHHHLCERMQCSINELVEARKELEHFLLLKSYTTIINNSKIYIYNIKRPLTRRKFLKHEIFSRMLMNKVGNDYVERIVIDVKEQHDYSNYKEITELMEIPTTNWTDFKEQEFQEVIEQVPDASKDDAYQKFDILSYLHKYDAREFMLPWSTIKKEDINTINDLGQQYKISYDQMIIALNGAINRRSKEINFSKLSDMCRKYSNIELEVTLSDDPMKYAVAIHPRKYLTDSEKNAVLTIKERYRDKVSNEVINNAIETCISNTSQHHIILNYVVKVIEDVVNNKERKVTITKKGKYRRVEEIPEYNLDSQNLEEIGEEQIKANMERMRKLMEG